MTIGGKQQLVVGEEKEAEESGYKAGYVDAVQYYPPELVGNHDNDSNRLYYRYLIRLQPESNYTVHPQDIVLAVRTKLGTKVEKSTFDLDVDGGKLIVNVKNIRSITLTAEQVRLCVRFQTTVFNYLFHNNLDKRKEDLGTSHTMMECMTFDYLLLPARGSPPRVHIDWDCIKCTQFQNNRKCDVHIDCSPPNRRGHRVHTINGPVCTCVLENSLVYTPHNSVLYCINGTLGDLSGTSILKDGESLTYKEYYVKKHGITLRYEKQVLLNGRCIFRVQNCLQKSNRNETREQGKATCELPPELCLIILSPISISTFYSFSVLPSIIHRIESLLLAVNLIRMDHRMQNVNIPTIKVLEAITTKKCQEKFHLESFKTLGDSFLKYAAGQQVFKMSQDEREDFLTTEKEKIISNDTLCKLGCDRRISGFTSNELFNPKTWIVPGDNSSRCGLDEEVLSCTKVYIKEHRTLKTKVIADVVKALVGAFLDTGGEKAAISFMEWLGLNVDCNRVAYTRPVLENLEKHVNVSELESLLNYRFRDATYLAEALTHGSYMPREITRCYQRLEFLGDSVLDYVITEYLYKTYPDLSPGKLTDLRSASVNNDRYALAAIKVGLDKHILHALRDLDRHIDEVVHNSEDPSSVDGESEITYPKVLGDVIESLASMCYRVISFCKPIFSEA